MDDQDESPDQERWLLIKRLFQQAARLPRAERPSYLDEVCGSDQSLHDEISKLLRTVDESHHGIESAIQNFSAHMVDENRSVNQPDRIGSYRIVKLIGEGGMGNVYLAERDDAQFQQQVAIKVLGNRTPGKALVQRFRSERQILANLNHPYIASLLDGGETADGLPFLVMEHVTGLPLLEYCDQHRLTAKQRLSLMTKVCEAVQHAHQNFVIHRDIKSSNVLVTEEGTPKLLDFGIAKLLETEQDLLHTVAETQAESRVLTPQNASPEQVLGQSVTTATDVYALGLLTYELLAGHSAYDLDSVRRGELERIICDVHPTKPSLKISEVVSQSPNLPALRGTTLEKLKKYLAGDLDTIILKALRKEPERRYATVSQFSDDIVRYLKKLPVMARPDSLSYRLGRFVDRNKAVLAAAFGVAAIVFGLVGYYTVELARERDLANAARDQALIETEKAEQVSDFLTDIFVAASPARAQGRELTAGEVLDAAVERVAIDLQDQPEVVAHLYRVMGGSYQWLGDYEKTEQLRRLTLDLRQKIGDPLMVANAYDNLGVILRLRGNYAESEENIRQAMEIYTSELSPPHKEIANIYNNYGQILRSLGRTEEAVEYSRKAVRQALEVHGENHPETADNMNNLAVHLDNDGQVLEALEWYQRALQINESVLGESHPDTANSMANLGLQYYKLGRFNEAEPFLDQALVIRTTVLGDDHPLTGSSLELLGLLHSATGNFVEAQAFSEKSIATLLKKMPEDHPRVTRGLRNLGRVYAASGRHQEAQEVLHQALERFEALGDRFNTCWTTARLGEAYFYAGDNNNARRYLRQADTCWAEYAPDSTYRVGTLPFLAEVTEDLDQAKTIANMALERTKATLTDNHPSTAGAMATIARLYLRSGEPASAQRAAEESLETYLEYLSEDHWEVALVRQVVGDALQAQGNTDEARQQWQSAAQALVNQLGEGDPRTLQALSRLNGRP